MNNIKNKNKGEGTNTKEEIKTDFVMSNCKGKNYVAVEGTSEFSDYQEIKLQELFKTLKPGLIPRSITIIMENTLVESCKPGDDVMITGILVQRWKNMPPT